MYVAISDKDTTHLLLMVIAGWVAIAILCGKEETQTQEGFNELMPDRLQDIYYFENTLSDVKARNQDAWSEDTIGKGPILGPYWAVDNSDVVEDTLAYSRGVYAYDPVKKRIGTYNALFLKNYMNI